MDGAGNKSPAREGWLAVKLAQCLTPPAGQTALGYMMRWLTERFHADGAAIWSTYKGSLSDAEFLSNPKLLTLASWFRDSSRPFATHSFRARDCDSGLAILDGFRQCDDIPLMSAKLQDLHGIFGLKSMMAVRIMFNDGTRGALSIYRRSEHGPFGDDAKQGLMELAELVPKLFGAIRNAESLSLLRRIGDELGKLTVSIASDSKEVVPQQFRTVFDQVCAHLMKSFHALEVSLYLRNKFVDPHFRLAGTTWAKPDQLAPLYSSGSQTQGLTSWVIENGRPAIISDWRTFERDKSEYAQMYPGLTWSDRIKLKDHARSKLNVASDDLLPPLSCLSTPIMVDGELVGVLRCSSGDLTTAAAGPWYYDQSDLFLLRLVADTLAQRWGEVLHATAFHQQARGDQVRIYDDLRHQIRIPLIQLNERLDGALRKLGSENHLFERDLRMTRGLARKAIRATRSIEFLAAAEEGDMRRKPNATPISRDELRKLLVETAMDCELMYGEDRSLSFSVERDSLNETSFGGFRAEMALLEQAVGCLADNAGKYSYPNTTVRFRTNLSGSGSLVITVENRGIPIRPRDIGKLKLRGYRTEEAQLVTGDGSGIGLWIVDRIMKWHGGTLEILPTIDGTTEVKLVFRPERVP